MVVVRGFMALLFLIGVWGLTCTPAYVVGQRRGVGRPGVAFIPLVGVALVLLWSIGRRGWMALLALVPVGNVFFWIWLMFALPRYHGRSLLWGVVLLVPVLGWYAYAFTLTWNRRTHGFTRTERRDWAWLR